MMRKKRKKMNNLTCSGIKSTHIARKGN